MHPEKITERTLYDDLSELLVGRCKNRRKLTNNTYLERRDHRDGGDTLAVILHSTDILTVTPSKIMLDSGGWTTITTKERMNRYLPPGCGIYQMDSVWYYYRNGVNGETACYQDGMEIDHDGKPLTELGADPREMRKLKRRISRYVKDYMQAFVDGGVPAPTGGDCWGCLMFDQAGKKAATGHLESHFTEQYYVPTLLKNAVERFPVSQAAMAVLATTWGKHDNAIQIRAAFGGIGTQQLGKSLKRYLLERFGFAS